MSQAIEDLLSTPKPRSDWLAHIEKLRPFNKEELFNSLFPLSVRSQQPGRPVAFAAYALLMLNPECLLNAESATEALLKEWDISIEEVVFYLARQFGYGKILAAVEKINATHKDIEARLSCIKYWASIWAKKTTHE